MSRLPRVLWLSLIAATLAAAGSTSRADGPSDMSDEAIRRITQDWRERLFLVVADVEPTAVEADRALEDPASLGRKRRVGCAVFVGHGRLLLTTAAVAGDQDRVELFTERGGHALARVLGTDPFFDLTVLEIDGDFADLPDVEPLSVAQEPRFGTPCLVLGSAYGRSLSLASGVMAGTYEIVREGMPVRLHRVQAPIYPGDSGGLLVDAQGRFVGIITSVCEPSRAPVIEREGSIDLGPSRDVPASQVGFAIPSRECVRAWTDLPRYHHIRRGFMGMEIEGRREELSGVRVLSVMSRGPAARAGIRPGDLITTYGDAFITGGLNLCALVASTQPLDIVNVRLVRDEHELVVPVQIRMALLRPGTNRTPLPFAADPTGLMGAGRADR